jgi:hypothetical protein
VEVVEKAAKAEIMVEVQADMEEVAARVEKEENRAEMEKVEEMEVMLVLEVQGDQVDQADQADQEDQAGQEEEEDQEDRVAQAGLEALVEPEVLEEPVGQVVPVDPVGDRFYENRFCK